MGIARLILRIRFVSAHRKMSTFNSAVQVSDRESGSGGSMALSYVHGILTFAVNTQVTPAESVEI
jgi:hypothetical protein